jgi:small GTP-binding protein
MDYERPAEFAGMRLSGYAAVADHGFALPCFRRGRRDNTWYVAVCSIPGDHAGTITDFEPFADGGVVPLASDLSRDVGRGDPWCDIFLWNGALAVGRPAEIWDTLAEQAEQIARLAPISFLDLAIAADRPERKELTRNAFLILTERYGSVRAVRWRDETFLRHVLLTRLRRFVSAEQMPEFARQLNAVFLTATDRGQLEVHWPAMLSAIGLDSAATSVVAELNYLTSLISLEVRLGQHLDSGAVKSEEVARFVTAKIVLLGDSGVGKSSLAQRLIHGSFNEQESTHGSRFWVVPDLGQRRPDGTECEAILWDFAGQHDYRLTPSLFVDNADLALLLFDAVRSEDPLGGVEFWLKQLQARQRSCPIVLVAARADRGTGTLTPEELGAFCQKHGIESLVTTSARTGAGIAELVERMRSMIQWDPCPRWSRPRLSRGSRTICSASREQDQIGRSRSRSMSFAPVWRRLTLVGISPTPR